jgi:hypothetical protein
VCRHRAGTAGLGGRCGGGGADRCVEPGDLGGDEGGDEDAVHAALQPAAAGGRPCVRSGGRAAGVRGAADQQAKLLEVFRKFTVASYAANFDSDEGEKLVVLPEQRSVGADVVVETQIVPVRGDAVRIDYVMHNGGSGWKAVDVLLNGNISQNAVKRSDFRNLVTTTSAQALIDSLTKKVGELSGGALS